MVILKASKTSTSRYVGSKIFIYASVTKNGFFPLKKMGRTKTLLDKLTNTHAHKTQQVSATVMVVVRIKVLSLRLWNNYKSLD
jgi:hypothetical protein